MALIHNKRYEIKNGEKRSSGNSRSSTGFGSARGANEMSEEDKDELLNDPLNDPRKAVFQVNTLNGGVKLPSLKSKKGKKQLKEEDPTIQRKRAIYKADSTLILDKREGELRAEKDFYQKLADGTGNPLSEEDTLKTAGRVAQIDKKLSKITQAEAVLDESKVERDNRSRDTALINMRSRLVGVVNALEIAKKELENEIGKQIRTIRELKSQLSEETNIKAKNRIQARINAAINRKADMEEVYRQICVAANLKNQALIDGSTLEATIAQAKARALEINREIASTFDTSLEGDRNKLEALIDSSVKTLADLYTKALLIPIPQNLPQASLETRKGLNSANKFADAIKDTIKRNVAIIIAQMMLVVITVISIFGLIYAIYCKPLHPFDYALDAAQFAANPVGGVIETIRKGGYESPLRKLMQSIKGCNAGLCSTSGATATGDGSKDTGSGSGSKCLAAGRSGEAANPEMRALARAYSELESGGNYTIVNEEDCYGRYQWCYFSRNNEGNAGAWGSSGFTKSPREATYEEQDIAFIKAYKSLYPAYSNGGDISKELAAAGTDTAKLVPILNNMCSQWSVGCGAGTKYEAQGNQKSLISKYAAALVEEKSGKCGSSTGAPDLQNDKVKNASVENKNLSNYSYLESLWGGVAVDAFSTRGPVIDEKKNHIVSQELKTAITSGKLQTALSGQSDFLKDVDNGLDPAVVNFLLNYAAPNGAVLTALSTETHRYRVGDVPEGAISRHSYGEAADFNLQYDTPTATKLVKMVKDAQANGFSISQWGADTGNKAVMDAAGMPNIPYTPDGEGHLHLVFGAGGSGSSTPSSGNCPGDQCGGAASSQPANVDKTFLTEPADKFLLKSPKVAMIHYTATGDKLSGKEQAEAFKKLAQTSDSSGYVHYLIDKDGTNYQIVDEKYYTAGVGGKWSGLFETGESNKRISDPQKEKENGVNYHAVQYEVHYTPQDSLNPSETISDAQLKSLASLITSSGFTADQVYTHWGVLPEGRHDADDWIRIDGTVTKSLINFVKYAGWASDDAGAEKIGKKILYNNTTNALKVYADPQIINERFTSPKSMLEASKEKLGSGKTATTEEGVSKSSQFALNSLWNSIKVDAQSSGVNVSGKELLKKMADIVERHEGYGADPNNIPTSFKNPGDLQYDGIIAKKFPTATKDAKTGFAKFQNYADGRAALEDYLVDILVNTPGPYQGSKTFGDVMGHYAPPSENDTSNYIKQFASLGITADTPLSEIKSKLGGVTSSGSASSPSPSGSVCSILGSTSLLEVAKKYASGKPARGVCFSKVADYIDEVGFGKIGGKSQPNVASTMSAAGFSTGEARNFAEFLNANGNAAKYGIRNLLDTNKNMSPYDAPAGSIVVVSAGSPGTSHPTAGDITVRGTTFADGVPAFYNDGEMGYNGADKWNGSTAKNGVGKVLGIYVPI